MKYKIQHIIIGILALLLANTAFTQTIEPSVNVTQDTNIIRIGEQVTLTLDIYANASDTVILPQFKDTITSEIEIAEVLPPDTSFDDDNITVKQITQTIKVTSFDSGVWVVPPIPVVINNDTISSEPLMIIVQTVDVDTAKAIKPIAAPYTVTLTLAEWLTLYWYWIALAIVVLALTFGVIYYLKKRKKEADEEEVEPEIPLDEIINERISRLEQQKLWQQGQIKAYYSEVSEILRFLLENTLHFNALELPTGDIIKHLKYQGWDNTKIQRIRHILTVSDLAKYAKEQPLASENEAVMVQLKEIAQELLAEYNKTIENQTPAKNTTE